MSEFLLCMAMQVYSLSTDRSAIPLRITNYFKIGSKLHFHCKLIDQIHDVMRVCGSFALLFPYRNDLKETLDHMLVLAQGQPGHGISLTQTMQDAIQLVHRVCPEEQMVIMFNSNSIKHQMFNFLAFVCQDYWQGCCPDRGSFFENYCVSSHQTNKKGSFYVFNFLVLVLVFV